MTASFLEVVLNQGSELWLSSPITDLVIEDGEVVGGPPARVPTAQVV